MPPFLSGVWHRASGVRHLASSVLHQIIVFILQVAHSAGLDSFFDIWTEIPLG